MSTLKLLWCLFVGLSGVFALNSFDGSKKVEPSYFFMATPLISVEDLLSGFPELEEDFYNLSPQERAQFADCIALINEAFWEELVKNPETTKEEFGSVGNADCISEVYNNP